MSMCGCGKVKGYCSNLAGGSMPLVDQFISSTRRIVRACTCVFFAPTKSTGFQN